MRNVAIPVVVVSLFIFVPIAFQPALSKGGEIPDRYVKALLQNRDGNSFSVDAENIKGQTVEIMSWFGCHLCDSVPYVLILEVRNKDGITTFLQWQNGTIGPYGESYPMRFYWQPTETGSYEVRNYAISNFTRPEILASVTSSHANIT